MKNFLRYLFYWILHAENSPRVTKIAAHQQLTRMNVQRGVETASLIKKLHQGKIEGIDKEME